MFGVEKSDVQAPLAQLQLTSINQDEMVLLVGSLNKAAGSPLAGPLVQESVEVWWPRLEAVLAKIDVPAQQAGDNSQPAEPAQPAVDVSEMFEEILVRMRSLERRIRLVEPLLESPRRVRPHSDNIGGKRVDAAASYIKKVVGSDESFDLVRNDGKIEIRIPGHSEISENLAEAAEVIARAEDLEVSVHTAVQRRVWAAGGVVAGGTDS